MTDMKLPLRVESTPKLDGPSRVLLLDAVGKVVGSIYGEERAQAICEAVNASRDVGRDARQVTDEMVARARRAYAENTKGRYLDNALNWQRDYDEDMRAALEAALRDEKGKV